jgi:hypothetical protein
MFCTGCCLIGACYIRMKYFSNSLCPRKSVFVQTVPNTYLECITCQVYSCYRITY